MGSASPSPAMNRQQIVALSIAAANLALMLLFPPHDYLSLQRGNVPTFDGFYFALAVPPNRAINADFLALELIVVLINACIAWLLLRERPLGKATPGGNRYQRGVLWLVALNLMLVVLFPPFQNYTAITKAALPTFEGFYFIFADNSQRQLVTAILYLEVVLVLVNGALLWLLFKGQGAARLSAADMRSLAEQVRDAQRK
jgi:hypothetical protein